MRILTQKQIIKNNKMFIKSLLTGLLDFQILTWREIDKKEIREDQLMKELQRLLNENVFNLFDSVSLFDKK